MLRPVFMAISIILYVVRAEGLEPPRLASPEPKSGVSANFTTPAKETPGKMTRLLFVHDPFYMYNTLVRPDA